MLFPAILNGKQCLAVATTIVLNPVWNTLKAQFEKLFRQQDTVTRTSCNFVADLLTIQPTCAHSDAPNKGEEDKLQQKSRKTKMFSFPPRRLQQPTQLQAVPIVLTQQNVITSAL